MTQAVASLAIEVLAVDALGQLLRDLSVDNVRVAAVGIVGSIGQNPARIGNPHIRAHAAEGQLFRQALEVAASTCGLFHLSFSPRDLMPAAGAYLGVSADDLHARVHTLGKGVVRPWRAEERSATVAAWAVLATAPRPSGSIRSAGKPAA